MRAVWLLTMLLAALLAPATVARDDDGPEEFAAGILERLDEAIDEHDVDGMTEAVTDVDLVYDNVSEKTQKKLAKALQKFMAEEPSKALRADTATVEQQLEPAYAAAIGILYDKPGGVDVLRRTLKVKHLQEWWGVRGLLYEGIALSLDPDDIELIAEGLEAEDAALVASVGGTLAIYKEQPVEVRREAVEALIDGWEELVERAEKEARRDKGTEQREFLDQVEPALLAAAGDLTRRRHADLAALTEWFDEHGDEDDW